MSIKSDSDKVLRRPIKIGDASQRTDSRNAQKSQVGLNETHGHPINQAGVDRMLMPARVKKNGAPCRPI